ncbi:VWA domain-containing protein [Anaerobium acetethylicum]|uniref:VWA domain-containing protein n=1 Tax=Anaerobium acetethylicum TaxID=1619234 RepID=UPI0038B73612
MDYEITSISGIVISSGRIDVAEEWSFSDFDLNYGTNNVTVTATDSSGGKTSASIKLYNTNQDNMGDAIDREELVNDILSQDSDGDGLCNFIEAEVIYTDAFKVDSDEDGIADGNEDCDQDGVSNLIEMDTKTNPAIKDSDEDGLMDGEEIDTYKTDPLSQDTDGDKASDKWEIDNEYDPCVYNNSFVSHSEIKLNEKITEVSLKINGCDGNAAETLSISTIENAMFNNEIPGYIGDCCEFTTQGSFESAEVSYTLEETLFDEEDFVPALYYFNEETQLLEEVANQQINGEIVSATLSHFSKYILINKTVYDKSRVYTLLYNEDDASNYKGMDIVFAIDSSGSMTSNDRSGVRKTVTKNFINVLTENDRAAVVDFDSYASVYSDFTSDSETLNTAVNKIDSSGGTSLSDAMSSAIGLFTSSDYDGDGKARYIVLLTDGQGTYSTAYTTKAKDNGIVVYTVGLGSNVSTSVLTTLAEGTGGEYYHANNADKLKGIFDTIADKTDLYKDSDSDKLKDYYEKEINSGNLRLGTGVKLTGLNYLNADTDSDTLKDGEELEVSKSGHLVYVKMKSNPTTGDTDGDGLLDGTARIINGKRVAPKDPDLLHANGPKGIWQAQFEQESKGISSELGDWYEFNLDLSSFEGGIRSKIAAALGSRALNFKVDDKNIAVHSQVDTWQEIWGYNDFYDLVFRTGTNGNIRKDKFQFSNGDGENYIIWIWCGDYLNLGSGAEMGIYTNPRKAPLINLEHWEAVDFQLPMTLNLYNYNGNDDIENVFSWAPEDTQWWITGFKPDFNQPKVEKMVTLGTIDFTDQEKLYSDLKSEIITDDYLKKFMIFDDENHMVWIIWWEL